MGKKINLTIDGKKIQAMEGDKILWAALENDIYIPHLCAMKEQQQSPFAGCRLCFIEIEGKPRPVAACTEPALEGMVVNTRSESIDRLVEAGFNLIMSNHHIDCKICAASGACELQKIAKERKIRLKPKKLVQLDRNLPKDHSKDCIIYDPNKCVLCGRCVTACRTEGTAVLGLAYRGFERMVTTFGDIPLGETDCSGCGSCANVCPAGALIETDN